MNKEYILHHVEGNEYELVKNETIIAHIYTTKDCYAFDIEQLINNSRWMYLLSNWQSPKAIFSTIEQLYKYAENYQQRWGELNTPHWSMELILEDPEVFDLTTKGHQFIKVST